MPEHPAASDAQTMPLNARDLQITDNVSPRPAIYRRRSAGAIVLQLVFLLPVTGCRKLSPPAIRRQQVLRAASPK
jgi:hypothetical protein